MDKVLPYSSIGRTNAEYSLSMFSESAERAILRIASTLFLAFFARASAVAPQLSFSGMTGIKGEPNQLRRLHLTHRATAHHDPRWIEGSRLRLRNHHHMRLLWLKRGAVVRTPIKQSLQVRIHGVNDRVTVRLRDYVHQSRIIGIVELNGIDSLLNTDGISEMSKFHNLGDHFAPCGTPEKISFLLDD